MKPLCNLENTNKEAIFHLFVHQTMERINKEVEKWFANSFCGSEYIGHHVLVANLTDNLNYLFTEGIWLVELGESQGLDMTNVKKRLEAMYDRYTKNENGHRYLVSDTRYDKVNNRLFTEEEIAKRNQKILSIAERFALNILESGPNQ